MQWDLQICRPIVITLVLMLLWSARENCVVLTNTLTRLACGPADKWRLAMILTIKNPKSNQDGMKTAPGAAGENVLGSNCLKYTKQHRGGRRRT
jgi:hypothetical protein